VASDGIDRRSHRALDKALIEVDIHLQAWGRWARGEISRHAWPRESPMFKTIREIRLGISARSTATGIEAGEEVIAVDKAVAGLTDEQRRAIWAHYIAQGETRFHCSRHARMPESQFVRHLDRARWAVRAQFHQLLNKSRA
jgi:DNA-directed RNA polymerase specialized sigma24 family protein